MKKLILSGLSLCMLASAAKAQITFGPVAGLNISNYSYKGGGFSLATTSKVGGRFGGVVDIPLTDNINFQPGALYVMNGYKASLLGIVNMSATVSTVEVPVNFLYKTGHPGGNRFFAGAGPYFAYNVVAALATTTTLPFGGVGGLGGINDINNEIGNDSSAFIKAFDFGFGLTGGYQLDMGLFFCAHYQFGLANLLPMAATDYSLKNRNYGVSIGYLFGGKASKKERKRK